MVLEKVPQSFSCHWGTLINMLGLIFSGYGNQLKPNPGKLCKIAQTNERTVVLTFYTNLFSCCSSLSRICTMPGDSSSVSSTSVDSGLPNDTRASTSYITTEMFHFRYKLKHRYSLSFFLLQHFNDIKFAVR